MIFSKDYVGYLARQTVKQLIAEKMIATTAPAVVNERVTSAMVDELALEDYPEMFKKVKNELARKYKAVL
jgi:hypothetical protein